MIILVDMKKRFKDEIPNLKFKFWIDSNSGLKQYSQSLSCVFEGFFISLKACHVHYHLYVKTN